MNRQSIMKKLARIAGVLVILWLALAAWVYTSPLVVLHYATSAAKPVSYFFNEDDHITKEYISPGARVEFRTAHRPRPDYYISVSIPLASRDYVEIKPPFSRVDVYIGADTKIVRTVVKTEFFARFITK